MAEAMHRWNEAHSRVDLLAAQRDVVVRELSAAEVDCVKAETELIQAVIASQPLDEKGVACVALVAEDDVVCVRVSATGVRVIPAARIDVSGKPITREPVKL